MKNKKLIYVILAVVVLTAGGFFYWQKQNEEFRLITDETEMTKFVMTHSQEELDEYYRKVDELKASDTYGGKTPEETMELYIDALKKGDVELASKYFDWIDQEKEINELKDLSKEQIDDYLNVLQIKNEVSCNDVMGWCESHGNYKGVNILIARFIKIEQSGLWKLESL